MKTLEEDVVYLKNGSMIRGTITEQVPGESVTIQTFDGTVFHFPTTAIDRVALEPSRYTRIKVAYNGKVVPVLYPTSPGWYRGNAVSIAGNNTNSNLHIAIRYGYRWKHWLQTGVITGMDPYQAGLILPFQAELRGDLFPKPITPHYFMQGGYGLAANRGPNHRVFNGGLTYHVGGGLTFRTRRKYDLQFSLGYKWLHTYQEFEETPPWVWTQPNPPEAVLVSGTRNYRRITFTFGTNF
ncbi:MAG: hypothetical protein NWR72_16630 [Bacteroidia bacterium]|nr:hypothetical protein [Bacteroidia bacterium]